MKALQEFKYLHWSSAWMAQLVRSLERKAIGSASLPSATSFDLEESKGLMESNGLEFH